MKSDEELIEVLSSCEKYVQSKGRLEDKISAGILQLSMARKSGSRYSVSDCRMDFDAISSVVDSSDNKLRLLKSKGPDPISLIAALPPRPIRISQAHFVSALEDIVAEAQIVRALLPHLPHLPEAEP